jgi:hypothetical protein
LRSGAIEALTHEQMVVPDGVVGQRPRELEAVLPVEVGRLERVRVQSELAAAAATRDLLGGLQQATAEARPPRIRADPLGWDGGGS